jgi:hypothetical protein
VLLKVVISQSIYRKSIEEIYCFLVMNEPGLGLTVYLKEWVNNMKVAFVALLLLSLFVSGCATMSKDECKQADWYLKGVDDATQGFALDRVVEHGKACARINIVPDMKDYREGHDKGARLYCVPEKGYSEGRKGAAYNGICPLAAEDKFLRAYRDGQELYNIQYRMDAMRNQISNSSSQINNRYNDIDQLRREIVRSKNENDRRYKMRLIIDMENEIRHLDLDAQRADRELYLLDNDYRAVEDKHRRMGYIN